MGPKVKGHLRLIFNSQYTTGSVLLLNLKQCVLGYGFGNNGFLLL